SYSTTRWCAPSSPARRRGRGGSSAPMRARPPRGDSTMAACGGCGHCGSRCRCPKRQRSDSRAQRPTTRRARMYDEPPEPTDEMVEHEQQQAVMRAPTVRIDGITAEAVRNGSQEHASAPAAPEPEAP